MMHIDKQVQERAVALFCSYEIVHSQDHRVLCSVVELVCEFNGKWPTAQHKNLKFLYGGC